MAIRGIARAVAAIAAAALIAAPASAQLSEEQVRRAWHDVTAAAGMEELPLSFDDTEAPNAWVTAGKSVTVTRGLMAILDREAEIFGVLSHEAGHAYLKHYQGRVTNAAGIGIAAVILSEVIGNKIADVALGVGANLATAGYSREQEVEADDFATDLAFASAHDPTGLYNALERIVLKGGETQPSGFNSHPPDERRLGRIERRILERDASIRIEKLRGGDDEVGWEGDEQPDDSQRAQEERSELDAEIEKWRKELNMEKK